MIFLTSINDINYQLTQVVSWPLQTAQPCIVTISHPDDRNLAAVSPGVGRLKEITAGYASDLRRTRGLNTRPSHTDTQLAEVGTRAALLAVHVLRDPTQMKWHACIFNIADKKKTRLSGQVLYSFRVCN
jgi:hypothetical protein